MRRVLLVSNPASRRGAVLHARAVAALRNAGAACDAVLTEAPGHGGGIAAELASQYDAVFALGGDGTVMEIMGALVGSDVPLGVLPGGTGNLIARSLGVPLGVTAAVRALLRGSTTRMDLGRVHGGPRFAVSAGCGTDAETVARTPAALKQLLGMWAYTLAATRAVLRARLFDVRLEVDGRVIERQASVVMIVNQPTVLNGMFSFGPGISNSDGMLDLCVHTPRGTGEAAHIMWRLNRRDYRETPSMLFARGQRFKVETSPAEPAQADGELLGSGTLTVDVEPLAALFLTPAKEGTRT